ncbi:MAG: hypothetical protein GEU93_21975 [Propionibacteriales bacterium]|nr:hypothetical protein [Propionibacteriales bacterium]
MSTASRLAERARQAAGAPDGDAQRALLVHNCAAAMGEKAAAGRILTALADDAGSGAVAYRLAAAMHARAQDDFYPGGRMHVGAVVIPAVLAAEPDDMLPALAAGYAVGTGVSRPYSAAAQQRGFRPTGIFGPLAAAAASAVALDLDDEQLAHAISIATTGSAGTNQSWIDGSDEWLVEVAAAARSGVDAARLASAGVQGAAAAVDGGAGWAAAFFGDPQAQRLRNALDGEEDPAQRVAVKLYPISGIAQVPAHLAAEIGKETGRALPDSVRVHMPPSEAAYPGTANRGQFVGSSDSLMSVARCVALAYSTGTVAHAALAAAPSRAETAVMERLELVPDAGLEETAAMVSVTVDGQEATRRQHAKQLLYPSWGQTRAEIHDIAARNDASAAALRELAELVEAGPSARSILTLMGKQP